MSRPLSPAGDLYGQVYAGAHYPDAETANVLRNRRRLRIFLLVLVASLLVSLSWTFLRPAVYQSSATLLVTPPVINDKAGDIANSQHVELQRQVLLGNELRQAIRDTLAKARNEGKASTTTITAPELEEMIDAVPVENTNLIQLIARGSDRQRLPAVIEAWIDAYMASHQASTATESASEDADIQRQLDEFKQKVEAKRAELEQFRKEYDILSTERNENRLTKGLAGLTDSLNKANEAMVAAQSRVSAIKAALAEGRPVGSDRAQASLAGLEERRVDIEQQLKELENEYTPTYMSIDPRITALVRKKNQLEEEIGKKRREAGDIALAEAQQEYASARLAISSIQRQLDDQKLKVTEFTTRFAEQEALQEELLQLETQYRMVQQRQVEMDVDTNSHFSRIAIKEPPFLPVRPVYPNYPRDAAISTAVSLLLALLSVWLYDYLNRQTRQAAVPSLHPVFVSETGPRVLDHVAPEYLPHALAPPALEQQLPRELSEAEVLAQLENAAPPVRLLIACLLSGLNTHELLSLCWGDIDLGNSQLQIGKPTARTVTITPPLQAAITGCMPDAPVPDAPVWSDVGRGRYSPGDLAALVSCAAHDAGLPRPSDVTPQVFLHTYLAYLVRKGVRLSDLGKVFGEIPPTVLAAYGVFSPPGVALPLDSVDLVYPAVRAFFSTWAT